MSDQQIGNFRVIQRLGEGGMGEVVRAMDTMLEREVALKTLRQELSERAELVERFRVEAIALAKLNHPNIAAVYSFFRENQRYHMAMQFVPGQTLEQVLARRTRLPWQEAVRVAQDVLLALEHAHGMGVIHRDLKPANLMLSPEGRTVVMDFGIARVLARARQTRAGNLVGTMEYVSPEIVRGDDPDARADLYSLGVVLFELVTGRLPFSGDTDYALMRAHAELAPPHPGALVSGLPPALEAAILKALEKDPADRFADARAFGHALAEIPGVDAPRRLPIPLPRPRDWHDRLRELFATMKSSARRAGQRLQLPESADWSAWSRWGRDNPGLAVAAAASLLAAGFLVAGLVSRPSGPTVPPGPTPAPAPPPFAGPAPAPAPTPAPVPSAAPTPPTVPIGPVPGPVASDPRDVVMPPPARPNVVIEQTTPVEPPRQVKRPAEPSRPDGGWYVKR